MHSNIAALRQLGHQLFLGWLILSRRYAAWVLLALLIAATAASVYTYRNLGIHTDTADMLSEELPFRINLARFQASFPQYEDILLLVLDGPTPEQTQDAAAELTTYLKNELDNITDIAHLSGESFFQTNGLLYKTPEELAQLTDRLSAAQPLIARISQDPSLYAFSSVLTEAVNALHSGIALEIAPVLEQVTTTLTSTNESGVHKPLSWQVLFQEETNQTSYREFITLKPTLDFDQLFAAEAIMAEIYQAAQTLELENRFSTRLRITGDIALSHEELDSAMRGTEDASLIALVGTLIILFLALRSIGSITIVFVSLALGFMLTAAFATLAVGHLNLISIAFAVLYIGLGVDYAFHMLMRFMELENDNASGMKRSDTEILLLAGQDTGLPLVICALTTAIGFYAFIPTDYNGVAELGLISGTGMLISLVVTLTVVPALQRFLPVKPRPFASGKVATFLVTHWLNYPRIVCMTAVVTVLAALAVMPYVRFDSNLLNMNNQSGVAVQTFRELLADKEQTPWFAAIPVDSLAAGEQLKPVLTALPEVDRVISITDFIPEQQEEKLLALDEIALALGPDFFAQHERKHYTLAQQQTALQELHQSLEQFITEKPDHPITPTARKLDSALKILLSDLTALSTSQAEKRLRTTEQSLIGLLPESLTRLQQALSADTFTIQDLPDTLRTRWQSVTGDYLVIAYPASNIDDNTALAKFVQAVQQHAPQASGAPVIILEAGEAIVSAFITAFTLTLAGILLTLLWLVRNLRLILLVLAPLLMAALFTVAATVFLHTPFNFANVIALPLLLGMGLDSSIHMVLRSRFHSIESLLQTSTARAILYSAVTSIISFGSLVFSSHPGSASMGLLLAVGLLFILICNFLILPGLLQIFMPKTHNPDFPVNAHNMRA